MRNLSTSLAISTLILALLTIFMSAITAGLWLFNFSSFLILVSGIFLALVAMANLVSFAAYIWSCALNPKSFVSRLFAAIAASLKAVWHLAVFTYEESTEDWDDTKNPINFIRAVSFWGTFISILPGTALLTIIGLLTVFGVAPILFDVASMVYCLSLTSSILILVITSNISDRP